MNEREIPNSVIGVVADVLGGYYYSHSRLNALFMGSGAPGDPPEGNCVNKCVSWLKRCNDDPLVNPLEILGNILQDFMDRDFGDQSLKEKQHHIRTILEKNGLTYQMNGIILIGGVGPSARTLAEILKTGDFVALEREFNRALATVATDPPSGITAASSIIEALCKTYIHDRHLALPRKQNIQDLWRVVRNDLGLDPKLVEDEDQKKILSGLASIVDGVGSLRTHVGSAHGRGPDTKNAKVREAKLAISAAHSLCVYVLELWHEDRST